MSPSTQTNKVGSDLSRFCFGHGGDQPVGELGGLPGQRPDDSLAFAIEHKVAKRVGHECLSDALDRLDLVGSMADDDVGASLRGDLRETLLPAVGSRRSLDTPMERRDQQVTLRSQVPNALSCVPMAG